MNNWTIILMLILARQTISQADSNHTYTEDYPETEGHGAILKDYSHAKEIIAAAVFCTICFVLLAMLLVYFKFGRKNSACYTKNDPAAKDDQDIELNEIFIKLKEGTTQFRSKRDGVRIKSGRCRDSGFGDSKYDIT